MNDACLCSCKCNAIKELNTWGVTSPAAYPSTMGNKVNKVASSLDTTSILSTTTQASIRIICLYQSPLLEYPLRERTTNPQVNNEQN
jgi:hypothetical protein